MSWLSQWRRGSEPPTPSVAQLIIEGKRCVAAGDFAAAAVAFGAAAERDGTQANLHVNLGYALIARGLTQAAVAPLRRAILLAPDDADANYLLGAALLANQEPAAALGHLRTAVSRQPDLLPAQRDLARALFETGNTEEAESLLRDALRISPRDAELHLFLGNVLLGRRRDEEAIASYQAALRTDPHHVATLTSLAPALLAKGDVTAAAQAARAALAIQPDNVVARSNLLLALSVDGSCSPHTYLQEAKLYELHCKAGHESDGLPATTTFERSGLGRPLRVGFVSGDLRRHPVGYFLAPLLGHRERARTTFVAYNNHPSRDALTDTLRQGFDLWRDAWQLDDDALIASIRQDGIDILLDLSGHTPGNRLAVFARRAAPVQASWLGYWASTGLSAMDAFIADGPSIEGSHDRDFAEPVLCMPASRLCFSAPDHPDTPPTSPLPALRKGYITFASFQRVAKIDSASLELWARVLVAVPGARLRLQAAYFDVAEQRTSFVERLRTRGIDPARVDCFGEMPRLAYLAAHADVDVVLDTVVHTGATTTCEALWMGVPTLTLRGDRLLARQGASLLTAAGLSDWVQGDEAAFVAKACAVAADLPALAMLREGLRSRVAASLLMDGKLFARDFLALLERLRLQ